MTLSGVGPKVAACIALFSCDQHAAIPVDTHVWKIASKYYMPSLKAKTLTLKMHPQIMQVQSPCDMRFHFSWSAACSGEQRRCTGATSSKFCGRTRVKSYVVLQAFVDVFGEYAGWAHTALFISQLASQKHHLKGGQSASASSSESDSDTEVDPASASAEHEVKVDVAPAAQAAVQDGTQPSVSSAAAAPPQGITDSQAMDRKARMARRRERIAARAALVQCATDALDERDTAAAEVPASVEGQDVDRQARQTRRAERVATRAALAAAAQAVAASKRKADPATDGDSSEPAANRRRSTESAATVAWPGRD